MPRSSSYEPLLRHNTRYDGQSSYPVHVPTSHQENLHPDNTPQATRERIDSEHLSPTSRIMPNNTIPTSADVVLHHQHMYAVPWGYQTSHMMLPMPIMMPVHPHPQVMAPEGQESFDTEPVHSKAPSEPRATSPVGTITHGNQVSKMNAEHWVPITVLANFKKVKELTDNLQDVVAALQRSSTVSVDETGTLEIGAVFTEAGCPAKSITKEIVGNMWFVEFETASDALAMHNYTRGCSIRGMRIASRLKSNTAFTFGEYKSTPSIPVSVMSTSASTALGVSPVSTHALMPSPPSPSFDPAMMAMPMPYRRFPKDEDAAPADWGLETATTRDAAQGYPTGMSSEGTHSSDVYLPPVIMGAPTQSTASDGYYYNSQVWTPAGRYGMLPPDSISAQAHAEYIHPYPSHPPHPQQFGAVTSMGPRRNSDTSFQSQMTRRRMDESAVNKGDQRRRTQFDSSRGGRHPQQQQYRMQQYEYQQQQLQQYQYQQQLQQHPQQHPQQQYQQYQRYGCNVMEPCVFYSSDSFGPQRDRSDRSSDTKSDSVSSRMPRGAGPEKKKKAKSKKSKAARHQKEIPKEDVKIVDEETEASLSTSTPETVAKRAETEKSEESQEGLMNNMTNKMSKVKLGDHSKSVVVNKRKGSASQASRNSQRSPNLESDSFPPLPSHASIGDAQGDRGHPTTSHPLSSTWARVPKSIASTTVDTVVTVASSMDSSAPEENESMERQV
ncbi:La- protein 4 [Mortierella sp. GBA30]|nr:La- protein 4 [Mortierella sp. GBA30]